MSPGSPAYHWLRPDADEGPRLVIPNSLSAVDLRRGAWFERPFPNSSFALEGLLTKTPPHWLGDRIPLVSPLLLGVLKRTSIDSFQVFPVKLRTSTSGGERTDYVAFNVLGAVGAADPEASVGEPLMDEDPGPKVVDYSKLVLARSRTMDLDMFRLADSPHMLLVHDRVLRALSASAPPEGWGFTPIEIELRDG